MSRRDRRDVDLCASTTCTYCGKMGHVSRAAANKAARRTKTSAHLDVYLCRYAPEGVEIWHLGSAPKALVRGKITRDEVVVRRRTA